MEHTYEIKYGEEHPQYSMLMHRYAHIGCPDAEYEDNCAHPSDCALAGCCLDRRDHATECVKESKVSDEDWDDYDDYDDEPDNWEDPPLYASGELAAMDEARLQKEWQRQCNIHDHGVDNLPMGHPTIEDAQARLNMVEREQKQRGFETGPGDTDF